MRLIQLVLRHPVAVLALFATAFVVWLWRDSVPAPQPTILLDPADPLPFPTPVVATMQRFPEGSAGVLAKLKPGMTRAEVEDLIGTPAPHDIHPATVTDGKVTYQTAYGKGLGSTRQPEHQKGNDSAPKDRPFVTLEFDATKPGHPLVAVRSPGAPY